MTRERRPTRRLFSEPLEASVTPIAAVVNLLGDAGDANPGDGAADTDTKSAGLQTTLRAAIQETRASAGSHTITFDGLDPGSANPDGTFTITPEFNFTVGKNVRIDGT